MERRLLTFIVASTAFFFFYFSLRVMFAPQRPPQAANQQQVEAEADEGADTDAEAADADAAPDPNADAAAKEDDGPPPERPESEWVTLGSMQPTSGYFMLVTLNNRGGAIERIELTERSDDGEFRYRRVDVRHGYLGYLAGELAAKISGVRVNVVGPGTPADIAGLKVGDVIVDVNGRTIGLREDIEAALLETKPGDTISLGVVRGGVGTPIQLQATLTHHPLDLIRQARDGGADQVEGNLSRLSCLLTLSQVNRKSILPTDRSIKGIKNPAELNWDLVPQQGEGNGSAAFKINLSGGEMKGVGGGAVQLQRSYSLKPGSYLIDMSVQLKNDSDTPQDLAYRLEGANGITLEGWWYSTKISPNFRGGAGARDVVYKSTADGHELISGYTLLTRAKSEKEDPFQSIFAPDGSPESRQLNYIAVDAQYFTVAYLPPEGSTHLTSFRRAGAGVASDPTKVPRYQERASNSTFYLDSEILTLAAGESSKTYNLSLFAGPKQPELLATHGLSDCIYYGWFSLFARALASLLHVLAGVGNYALAIILLTVIVRGAMFPLSRKAAVSAQKMQELAPEIKKINDKYKDDMEGKLKAQRELQQRVGFNPLAGCLPMFLQLPIFIGLYRALSVDIELRQQAISGATSWASNLAGPDMFAYWGDWMWGYLSGRGTGWLGPYFNILPVIVVALFLAQQKMFMPPATDEQTAMTQKMMNIMTLMMGLFFFRVPAGLCIYFITSSLWGICERILVKKTLPKGKHFDADLLEGTGDGPESKPKSQSISERIRSQVAKPEATVERPNKRRRPKKKK